MSLTSCFISLLRYVAGNLYASYHSLVATHNYSSRLYSKNSKFRQRCPSWRYYWWPHQRYWTRSWSPDCCSAGAAHADAFWCYLTGSFQSAFATIAAGCATGSWRAGCTSKDGKEPKLEPCIQIKIDQTWPQAKKKGLLPLFVLTGCY